MAALQAMALSASQVVVICTLLIVSLCCMYIKFWSRRNPLYLYPMDWPVVGMLPALVARIHNFHDKLTAILAASGCNFKAQGPVGSGIRFFITSDPENVRHIYTSNHANYPKGEEFADIFDIISDTIFTADGDAWRQQRAMFQSLLSNPRLLALMASCCRDKVVNGLVPFLTHMGSTGTPFDMQDLITRLVFDLTATPIFGVDPGCLSCSMPSTHVAVATAMDTIMQVGLFRHTVPASFWKVMRWLNIGPERKLAVAHTVLHGFVREMAEKTKPRCANLDEVLAMDIICSDPVCSDDFLQSKLLIVYMIAGRDTVGTTLPWVFYNLAKNPGVVSCIRKELAPAASLKATALASNGSTSSSMVIFDTEETKGLVYLQAALFESLRLYPPGPLERKVVLANDVLPSGHQLCSGETVLMSIYAMGRMEALWGKDCHEYRPERWLSDDGTKLRYVPSHKFMAFNTGPRMCLGKDIAIAQMKTIVAAVVWNFDMEVLEGQSIEPKLSCLLQLKNGLMMRVKQRE